MKNISHEEALVRLKTGNGRFTSDTRAIEPLLSHFKMKELAIKGQSPFAVILTCSDSRSPVEMIFDQGIGDLFVVRVAGNVVAPSLLASIEFATANFGSPLVVVLGHTHCGAVKAALDHSRDRASRLPSPHLEELVGRIEPALRTLPAGPTSADSDQLQKAVEANVLRSCELIFGQSKIISDFVKSGRVRIVGGVLDISNGSVRFLEKNSIQRS